RLEREAPDRERAALQVSVEVRLHFLEQPPLLAVVHVVHAAHEREVEAGFGRGVNDRPYIFGETRAAVSETRIQEVHAEPAIRADSLPDGRDIGADALAEVRDLV